VSAPTRYHGQRVIVYDAKGGYENRGFIVGIHRCNPPFYDVQPEGGGTMAKRMCGIPADRLRSAGTEPTGPIFVDDRV
jgi:hypothetical protein